MQRYSFKFAVALLTFIIGVSVVTAWYFRRAEPTEPPPAINVAQPSIINNSEPTALYDPCAFSRPNNRRLEAHEAIRLAECFIIQNGYTDLPPIDDRSNLTPESVEPGTDEFGLQMRHDSLERRAYGFMHGGNGSLIVFRLKQQSHEVHHNNEGSTYRVGRAVTMDAYGRQMRMQHQGFFLDFPRLQRLNP